MVSSQVLCSFKKPLTLRQVNVSWVKAVQTMARVSIRNTRLVVETVREKMGVICEHRTAKGFSLASFVLIEVFNHGDDC